MAAGACVTVDLTPLCLNIKGVRAGDQNIIGITLRTGGAAWDLTGAVLTAQARSSRVDPDPALVADIDVVDPTAGRLTLAWPGDDIAALLGVAESWSGIWDLQILESGAALPVTILAGTLDASTDITR